MMLMRHSLNKETAVGTPPSARHPLWMRLMQALVHGWAERSRQRHRLAILDDAALRDIGLTHQDVQREISKPFWRL